MHTMLIIGIALFGIIILLAIAIIITAKPEPQPKVIARYTQRGWRGHSKNF